MRIHSLAYPLILALIPSCGVQPNDPGPPVSVLVDCVPCRALGITAVTRHVDSGAVETRSLDDADRAAFSIPTTDLELRDTWFTAGDLPLRAEPEWSPEAGDLPDRIHLDTFDLGPTPLQDTVIHLRLAGSRRAQVQWSATFAATNADFPPVRSYQYTIDLPPQGTIPLRLPVYLTRPDRSADSFPDHDFRTTHTRSYLGVSFLPRPFDSGLATFRWPPETMPLQPIGNLLIWNEIDVGGNRRWIRLDRIDSTSFRFLQIHSRAGSRTQEDSGSWDPRTEIARFLRRRPGTPESYDSSSFAPRRILHTDVYPLTAWRETDPPLDSTMKSVRTHPAMKFFVLP